jgi:site-specific DNA-cytosine methylase
MNLTSMELFSGIGGSSLGLSRAGYNSLCHVEWNLGSLNIHGLNLKSGKAIHADVTKVQYNELPEVDLLWGSPVCCSYTNANPNKGEKDRDIENAKAVVRAASRSSSVAIENVPGYLGSDSFRYINDRLIESGKHYTLQLKIQASDFGNPSSRTRLFALYSQFPILPADNMPSARCDWFKLIQENVSLLERSVLTDNQKKAIQFSRNNGDLGFYDISFIVERAGYYGTPKIYLPEHNSYPCIKAASHHTGLRNAKEGYGSIGRYRRYMDVVINNQSFTVTIPMLGLLMGFPVDYNWGEDKAQAGAGIGNAVVPCVAEYVASLFQHSN